MNHYVNSPRIPNSFTVSLPSSHVCSNDSFRLTVARSDTFLKNGGNEIGHFSFTVLTKNGQYLFLPFNGHLLSVPTLSFKFMVSAESFF